MRKKVLCLLPPILLHAAIAWAQWQPQTVTGINQNHTILSIAAVNQNIVWAIVDTNYFAGPANVTSRFLRTTNGGTTWKTGTIPNTQGFFFMDIAAIDSNIAWVTINDFNGSGGIYKTTNGGASWVRQASFSSVFIYFFDAQNGVQINQAFIQTTNNGGTSWAIVSNVPPFLPNEFNLIYAANNGRAQIGDTIWVGTSKGRVYRSTNRGQSWTVSQTPLGQNATIHSLAFRDGKNGLAVSAHDGNNFRNQMAKTNDGGVTWTTITAPAIPTASSLAYVPETANSYVLTGGSNLPGSSYTKDGGATWTNVDNIRYYRAVAFVAPDVGWAGGYTTATHGGMYKWRGTALAVVERKDEKIPQRFELSQNYPNPFNPSTIIGYHLPSTSLVTLKVYDLLGHEIATLVHEQQVAGKHEVNFNASHLPDGLYFYRLEAMGFTTTKKMLLAK